MRLGPALAIGVGGPERRRARRALRGGDERIAERVHQEGARPVLRAAGRPRRRASTRRSRGPRRGARPSAWSQRQLREVAAAVKDQRVGVVLLRATLDLADEDDVIAFLIAAAIETFEDRRGAVEDRHAVLAGAICDAFETVDLLASETLGQRVLIRCQAVSYTHLRAH